MKSKFFHSLIFIFCLQILTAQEALTPENLAPITKYFQIEDGQILGDGAGFLLKEMSIAQFTMIGEYHGSKRISEFTEAIIPHLNGFGYTAFALELGPTAATVLNSLKGDITNELKKINNKYQYLEDGDPELPIPFFETIEDAQFLVRAKELNWEVFGIDQEFYNSFVMLSDLMFENLSRKEQKEHQTTYRNAINFLNKYYGNEDLDLPIGVQESEEMQTFLKAMEVNNENVIIGNHFKKSIEIYGLNSKRKWYENNSVRIDYMKQMLRKGLQNIDFDISKDKMLIKMGGYHLGKGFSPLALYEVGNTLNELAEYHGNKSLNIGFSNRFYMEEGQLKDIMESQNKFQKRLKNLNQMGKEQEWAVIDLRKLIKGHFYNPVKYKFNEHVENLVKRYDLLVIPKTEIDSTPNYTLKN